MCRDDEQYRDMGRPGRRRIELTAAQRQAIVAQLRQQPNCSIAGLRRAIQGLPRNTTTAYVRRCRRLHQRQCRRSWRIVRWHRPGAVWAIDGTWLDQPVAPFGRRAMVVAELYSRRVLALSAVRGERASAAEEVLARLIAAHGAPLVLKLDNGSAFTAKRFASFCRGHGITLLHSPVRRPRFNGTCEVSGRWAKHRALAAARLRGSAGPLCQADLDAAPKCVGPMAKCTSRISSSPSPQSGGLPSIRRPANMSTARWRAWPSSGRSNSATSSPAKAVSIAGVCGLVQRERTATCTALGALKQRTSELRRTDSGGS